ncbi:MAG: hypothetical protein H3Z53_10380 [archaeon]|nr:hypothetical protein [archaeon]MCP8314755.1 hypothetical protein [archaeon]
MARRSLSEALKLAHKNLSVGSRIWRELEHGSTETLDSLPESEGVSKLELPEKWWLETFFKKGIFLGANIIFLIVAFIPKISFAIYVHTQYFSYPDALTFSNLYLFSIVGDWFLIVPPLLFLGWLFQKFKVVSQEVNGYIEGGKIAPPVLVKLPKESEDINSRFLKRFFEPILLKSCQDGLDLAYSKKFQILCSVFVFGFSYVLLNLWLSPVYNGPSLSVLEDTGLYTLLKNVHEVYLMKFLGPLIWGILSIPSWTCSVGYIAGLSGFSRVLSIVRIPNFKPLLHHFRNLVGLFLSEFKYMGYAVGFGSIWIFIWSLMPTPYEARVRAFYQAVGLAAFFVPLLLTFIFISFYVVHLNIENAKTRELEALQTDLEKSWESKDFKTYRVLREEYMTVVNQKTWPFTTTTLLQILFVGMFTLTGSILNVLLLSIW